MLSIYNCKMFTSYCFCTKISERLYQKGWHFTCHLKTGRNVKHLSLENVYVKLFSMKISVRLYQKGWQFICNLRTGRNVTHLSLENVYLKLIKYENKCKVLPKGVAVQLPPNNR